MARVVRNVATRWITVVGTVVACAVAGGGIAVAAPVPPPLSEQSRIVATFHDPWGTEVPYRQGWHTGGSTGFGYAKVTGKHGITNDNVLRAVLRAPQEQRQEGDGRWVYEKQAVLYGFFTVSDQTTVRIVVSYTNWQGDGEQGVVTAYCVGYNGQCPAWINDTFPID